MTEKERVYKLLWELSRRDDMVAVQPYELRVLLEDLEMSKKTFQQIYMVEPSGQKKPNDNSLQCKPRVTYLLKILFG